MTREKRSLPGIKSKRRTCSARYAALGIRRAASFAIIVPLACGGDPPVEPPPVVPSPARVRLVVYNNQLGRQGLLYGLDTNGVGQRMLRLAPLSSRFYAFAHAYWMPGDSVLVTDGDNDDPRVFRYTFDGSAEGQVQPFVRNYLDPVPSAEALPQPSRDGRYVYFAGPGGGEMTIWRVRADGDSARYLRLIPPNDIDTHVSAVSPSPDGLRLAVEYRDFGGPTLGVVDLATLRLRSLNVPGEAPRWSPTSDMVAYVAGSTDLRVINALDGSWRTIAERPHFYDKHVDWSPDGSHIVARCRTHNALELISPDGQSLRAIPNTTGYFNPTWRDIP